LICQRRLTNLHALFIKLMKRNVSVQLLGLLENMLFDCYSCVKWENIHSDFFTVMFGVRQGSVLAPFLFAVFVDELSDTCNLDRNRFIVLYAGDILLISPSVVNLENLIHLCDRDMAINYKKKSCWLRIGQRCDVSCANIISLNGHVLPWTNVIRYLGIFIVQSRAFKCSIDEAKRSIQSC